MIQASIFESSYYVIAIFQNTTDILYSRKIYAYSKSKFNIKNIQVLTLT